MWPASLERPPGEELCSCVFPRVIQRWLTSGLCFILELSFNIGQISIKSLTPAFITMPSLAPMLRPKPATCLLFFFCVHVGGRWHQLRCVCLSSVWMDGAAASRSLHAPSFPLLRCGMLRSGEPLILCLSINSRKGFDRWVHSPWFLFFCFFQCGAINSVCICVLVAKV